MRDNYHLLKEHGLCPRCKRDSPPQQTYCNMCLEDYRRRRIPETPEQRSQHARKAVLARWARRRLT